MHFVIAPCLGKSLFYGSSLKVDDTVFTKQSKLFNDTPCFEVRVKCLIPASKGKTFMNIGIIPYWHKGQ